MNLNRHTPPKMDIVRLSAERIRAAKLHIHASVQCLPESPEPIISYLELATAMEMLASEYRAIAAARSQSSISL